MKHLFFSGIFATLLFSATLHAGTLDDAKAKGWIGETEKGYIAAIVDNSETRVLVADVNAKRKAKYLQLASKNNISLTQVEQLAAEKAYSKTASGHYVRKAGKWVKK